MAKKRLISRGYCEFVMSHESSQHEPIARRPLFHRPGLVFFWALNGSMELAKKIWCADNQIKAWDDYMLKNIAPTSKECETPLDVLVKSGRENKVSGTPTLVFADGSIVGGMIPASVIEEKLNNAANAIESAKDAKGK